MPPSNWGSLYKTVARSEPKADAHSAGLFQFSTAYLTGRTGGWYQVVCVTGESTLPRMYIEESDDVSVEE